MQELIQQVQERAGVSAEQAAQAIEAVKDFVKSKLPPMLAGNVDTWFSGLANTPKQDKDDDFLA
ncbi:hypothetical protein MKQ68_24840 [Chitinophaga horti]|uniref:DUF2267 domain-containing protein n=1 Tax=Chitinophaga horti TaxID=2920382 RepID=A0ABY6J105_9BACT|nr:hypothetical protein [Chitinophaga horti]UYQ93315.1 hypothetical protein MKQ68_24840 [Chitinophaga horti]